MRGLDCLCSRPRSRWVVRTLRMQHEDACLWLAPLRSSKKKGESVCPACCISPPHPLPSLLSCARSTWSSLKSGRALRPPLHTDSLPHGHSSLVCMQHLEFPEEWKGTAPAAAPGTGAGAPQRPPAPAGQVMLRAHRSVDSIFIAPS